jgi:hypothetical protein
MSADLQTPFDASVVMVPVVRDTFAQALRSVFAQAFAGRMQVLGVDRWLGDRAGVEELARQSPSHIGVTLLDLGYRTPLAGLHPYLLWRFKCAGVDLAQYLPHDALPGEATWRQCAEHDDRTRAEVA